MLMRFALIALLFVSVPLYAAPSGEEPEAAPGSPAAESASPPPGLDGVVFKDEGTARCRRAWSRSNPSG